MHNHFRQYIQWIAVISFPLLVARQARAQQREPFRTSFDTLPTQQTDIADVHEGYIVVDDGVGALEVSLMTADFRSQTLDTSGHVPFQYWITPAANILDLKYAIDTELKEEGAGSLNVTFKRGPSTYFGGAQVLIFFPPFDARGADIRFSLRSENNAGQSVYVHLLDEMYKPCECRLRPEADANGHSMTGLTVCGRTATPNAATRFEGKIAEILVYDANLAAADIEAVETYLLYKYILTKGTIIAVR